MPTGQSNDFNSYVNCSDPEIIRIAVRRVDRDGFVSALEHMTSPQPSPVPALTETPEQQLSLPTDWLPEFPPADGNGCASTPTREPANRGIRTLCPSGTESLPGPRHSQKSPSRHPHGPSSGKPLPDMDIESHEVCPNSTRIIILDKQIVEMRYLTPFKWFVRYNDWRPHETLGNLTPAAFYQNALTGTPEASGATTPEAA
jgi:hypothetical protein